MKLTAIAILASALMVTGCESPTDWNLHVLATADNPNNGMAQYTSSRAEVVADHCGILHRSCVSVRILDETGFANAKGGRVFTYARQTPVTINWLDGKTLSIHCGTCVPDDVVTQLPSSNFFQLKYEI